MEVFRTLVSLLFSWAAIFHQWLRCWFSIRNHSLLIWETSSSSILVFIITVCSSRRTRRNKILKSMQSRWGKFHPLWKGWSLSAKVLDEDNIGCIQYPVLSHMPRIALGSRLVSFLLNPSSVKWAQISLPQDQETGSTGSSMGFSYQGWRLQAVKVPLSV